MIRLPVIAEPRAVWMLHSLLGLRAIAARGGLGPPRTGALRVEGVYAVAEEQLAITLRRAAQAGSTRRETSRV